MKRSAPIVRKVRVKKSRPRRRGEDLEPKYVEFLHQHGICPVCLRLAEGAGEATPEPGHCEGAHTANGGMRQKGPDSSRAPLCRAHHRLFDAGRLRFESRYGLDMKEIAAGWYARYLRSKNKGKTEAWLRTLAAYDHDSEDALRMIEEKDARGR